MKNIKPTKKTKATTTRGNINTTVGAKKRKRVKNVKKAN